MTREFRRKGAVRQERAAEAWGMRGPGASGQPALAEAWTPAVPLHRQTQSSINRIYRRESLQVRGRTPTRPSAEGTRIAEQNPRKPASAGNCLFSSGSQSSDPRPGLGFPHGHPNNCLSGGRWPCVPSAPARVQRLSPAEIRSASRFTDRTGASADMPAGWHSLVRGRRTEPPDPWAR